jgi:hypothetical protein
MTKTNELLNIAQQIADKRSGFFEKKGAGEGDKDTNSFMKELRLRAKSSFGSDFSEKRICGDTNLAVDFFFPDEGTIIEVALSLRNPNSEFEHDILKAIMAKEGGARVRHLLFVSKPGAIKRHQQPGSIAMQTWVRENHGIEVTISELRNNHAD